MNELKHELHQPFTVYFELRAPMTQELFGAALDVLEGRCGEPFTTATKDQHWSALQERLAGRAPWRVVAPRFEGADDTIEGITAVRESVQNLRNVLARRPFLGYELDGVRYTLDGFSPMDSGLSYRDSSRPVLALLFASSSNPSANFYYSDPPSSFYEIVAGLDRLLTPAHTCGTFSIAPLVVACAEGRLNALTNLWELLHPLTIVTRGASLPSAEALTDKYHLVRPLEGGRLLLQVLAGFDPGVSTSYDRAASLIGRRSWTYYVKGSDAPQDRTVDTTAWPTAVRADGRTETSVELINGSRPALTRQGLYQMQAAAALQDRGYEVRALQVPLVGDLVRITIPIVLSRTPGPDGCVYTQCETWTAERISTLQTWIGSLRQESDSDVIVVSREVSAEVAALEDVTEFIHLPYDNLPLL